MRSRFEVRPTPAPNPRAGAGGTACAPIVGCVDPDLGPAGANTEGKEERAPCVKDDGSTNIELALEIEVGCARGRGTTARAPEALSMGKPVVGFDNGGAGQDLGWRWDSSESEDAHAEEVEHLLVGARGIWATKRRRSRSGDAYRGRRRCSRPVPVSELSASAGLSLSSFA